MEKQNNIPKLRFPEFSDVWEIKKGSDVFNNISDKKHNSDLPILAISQDFGAIPRDLIDYKISVTEKSIDSYKIVRKGNFIISLRSFQGGIEYSEYEGICSPAYIILKSKISIYDYFFKYYLKTNKYIVELNRKLEGIRDGKMISYTYFSDIDLPFPSLPEQQKIATFLSIVDEKLQTLKKKKSLLETYKKGVMQKLFSQEIRFKNDEGNDFEEWEVTALGEVADIKRGAASQHLTYINEESEGIRFLRINDFLNNDPVYVKNTDDMLRFTVKANDLLMAGTGATAGIVFIVPEKFNNLPYSYNAPRIRVFNAYYLYIYYFLISDAVLRQQKGLFVGNAQHFLDTDAIRSIRIDLPFLKEQTKIANFLTAIDAKINKVDAQIKQTELWKKGLLQQMFV